MDNAFLSAIKPRRSQYALDNTLPIPQAQVTALIQEAIRLSPSAFNSQSSRAVILYHSHSHKFWNIVKQTLRQIVHADEFAETAARIESFAAGAGTVLFYEDQDTVGSLQQQFPLYADNFPVWSEQASGMAQFSVWSALACAGIGASLQHYNPLPDAEAALEWNIPPGWKLRAQMPFGGNKGGFGEKTFIDDDLRFRTYSG